MALPSFISPRRLSLFLDQLKEIFASKSHTHTKSQISDMPTTLPNPYAMTISLNGGTSEGSTKFTYNGSSNKSLNISPGNIGAATSGHAHTPSQVGVIGAAPTSGQVAVFDGTTGKIKSTGFTINASVPAGAKFTDTVYTHPTSSGNKHIPSGGSSGQILRWSADGTAVWGNDNNTTYSVFKGATTSAAGGSGLVPAPTAGKQTSFLRGDGTWVIPTNTTYGLASTTANGLLKQLDGSTSHFMRGDGTWATPPNTTYGVVTTSANGLMSSSDKSKLDGIAAGANKYVLPTASKSTLGGVKTTSSVTSTSGYTACPIINGVVYYKDTNTTYSLSSFGISASAAELNYCDGVTSDIQTQLNALANRIATLESKALQISP